MRKRFTKMTKTVLSFALAAAMVMGLSGTTTLAAEDDQGSAASGAEAVQTICVVQQVENGTADVSFPYHLCQVILADYPIEDIANTISEAAAGLSYTIYDTETDAVLGTDTTDETGGFSLRDGEYAEFLVPAETDWYVYQDTPEDHPLSAEEPVKAEGDHAFVVEDVFGVVQYELEEEPAPTTSVDKTALEAEIEKAEALDESDYTTESWEALQEALENAKAVFEDPDATQEEVDEALDELEKARADLEKKDDGSTPVPDTVNITGTKTWDDNDNQDGLRPASITVNLLADDEVVKSATVAESADGSWTYTFEAMPKYDESGEEITYTVTEDEIAYYETSIDGYDITNSHTPATGYITIEKVWDDNDNQDGVRPENVTVGIFAGNTYVDSKEITEADGWTCTFDDLPLYEDGEEIEYTVYEEDVEGYTGTVDWNEDSGIVTFTNSYTPEETNVTVRKVWEDAGDQDGLRPENVTVSLLADGQPALDEENEPITGELNEDNDWTYDFTGLDKYAAGEEIAYTVTEDEVAGYTAEDPIRIEGTNTFILVNTHEPALYNGDGNMTITKAWDDEDDSEGVRPDYIQVTVKANDEVVRQESVTEAEDWTCTFTDLPQYADGQELTYTVEETLPASVPEDAYTSAITEADGVVTITNTHEPSPEPTVDKDALQKEYDEDSQLNEDDYTSDSWAPFEEALDKAADVLADPDASQEVVDEALEELKDAKANLQEKVAPAIEDVTITATGLDEDNTKSYDGKEVTLTVTAETSPEGAETTYTWYKDGTIIDGATGAELTLAGNISDSGTYTCVVTVTNDGIEATGSAEITIMIHADYSDLDEEIVPDESDPSTWEDTESVSAYSPVEIEMSTALPHMDGAELSAGGYSIVFHDELASGLTLDEKAAAFTVTIGGETIDSKYYTITLADGINPVQIMPYAITLAAPTITDSCAFHVEVDLTALYNDKVISDDSLTGETELMLFFYADLEGDALAGSYTSTAWYEVYSSESDEALFTSPQHVITVTTYEIEITKYDASQTEESALAGATLGIYSDEACTNAVTLNGEAYTAITGEDGTAAFYGLAEGTYYIKESKAPSGYFLSATVLTVDLKTLAEDTYVYSGKFANTPGYITFIINEEEHAISYTELEAAIEEYGSEKTFMFGSNTVTARFVSISDVIKDLLNGDEVTGYTVTASDGTTTELSPDNAYLYKTDSGEFRTAADGSTGEYWLYNPVTIEVTLAELPAAVNYAVKIWGINADTYSEDGGETSKTAGLTFGPATGDNEDGTGTGYITSYKAHLTQEEYESKEKGVCIHWMTWDEIIAQSAEDPTVFEGCKENGCTKAVELTPNETLFNMTTVSRYMSNSSYTGDGVSTLFYLLNGTGNSSHTLGTIWNYSRESDSSSDPANIYSRSRIRTTLTGDRSNIDEWLTDNPGANDYYGYGTLCDTSDCLLSCFPSNLQEAMVPRTTSNTGNATSGTSANDKTTYDKLFLFSLKEIGISFPSDDAGGDDYGVNPNVSDRVAYEFSGADAAASLSHNWWTRSRYSSDNHEACEIYTSGNFLCNSVNGYSGLSPGFCLAGPEETEPEAFAVYSEKDSSLTFYYDVAPKVGDTYDEKVVTVVYTGLETLNAESNEDIPWNDLAETVTSVVVDASFKEAKPISFAYWFFEFSKAAFSGFANVDTSNATSLDRMFAGCESMESIDVADWNISNVTDLGGIFYNCYALNSVAVSKWVTSQVTDMTHLFYNCTSLTELNVSGWNTKNVTTMRDAFYNCDALQSLDLSQWQTGNVTTMYGMFWNCKALKSVGDLSKWDTSNVENMYCMFYNCFSLEEVNVASWNTEKVTNMGFMFNTCTSLKNLDISGWNTSNVTTITNYLNFAINLGEDFEWIKIGDNFDLFSKSSTRLVSQQNWYDSDVNGALMSGNYMIGVTNENTGNTEGQYWTYTTVAAEPEAFAVYCADDNSLTFYMDTDVPTDGGTYKDKEATKVYTGLETLAADEEGSDPNLDIPWNDLAETVTSVLVDESFKNARPISLAYWFYGFTNAAFNGLGNVDTSHVTSTERMFARCYGLVDPAVGAWDMSNVTLMDGMFQYCTGLTTVDVAKWDTSSATYMAGLFGACSNLTTVDVSNWNTSENTSFNSTFYMCSALTSVDVSGWVTSNVVDVTGAFQGCESLENLDVSKWTTTNLQYMWGAFGDCPKLESLDLSAWTTGNVTDMEEVFVNDTSLTSVGDISGWDTSNVVYMARMFENCENLTTLDLSGWNTGSIGTYANDCYADFATGCTSLDWIKIGNDFGLFTKSTDALVSQQYWYDSDVDGALMSENYMIGVTNENTGNESGQYWTHTTQVAEPAVKYAVKIWGIGADTYQDEDDGTIKTAGLTFGPATGDNEDGTGTGYITSYKAHLTQEEYDSGEKGVCIHWMTWDDIIEQSKTNPEAFRDCLENGCTKAVELTPNETLFNMTTVDNYVGNESYTGDGVSTLYYLLNGTGSSSYTYAAIWNYSYTDNPSSDPANIYSRSRIRTTLTGDRSNIDEWLTDNPGANDYYGYDTLCDTSDCLLSCFPSNLQEAMVLRTTINTGNATSGTSANDKATYDKLFLFSAKESGATRSADDSGGENYGVNSADSDRIAYEFNGTSATNASARNWWTRSRYSSNNYQACEFIASGSLYSSVNGCSGLSPGFCLAGPEETEPEAFAVYSEKDSSLTFYYDVVPTEGDDYNDKTVTNVYPNLESLDPSGTADIPWTDVREAVESVVIDESFAEAKPINLAGWFYGFKNASFTGFENLNTSEVRSMQFTFYDCEKLETLNVSDWDTSNVRSLYGTFAYCTSLATLDVSGWDTSHVTDMTYMFFYCTNLTSLGESGASNLVTSSVTSLFATFYECASLTKLDVSKWDTSNLEDLSYTFYDCYVLENLDVSGWNTEKVTTLNSTFTDCDAFTSLDLSNWKTEKVTTLYQMFWGCEALTSVGNLSGWDTANVEDMHTTFYDCSSLEEVNVAGWNTEKVTVMDYTFRGCSALSNLDLSGWDTSNVTTYDYFAYLLGDDFDWIKIGDNFDLFSKSSTRLVSQQYWYDSDVNGNLVSSNYMIGVSGAGQYWTHTTQAAEPAVKYAVKIWGIGADTYQDEDDGTIKTAGLTFGPATGDNEDGTGTGYITSYKAHLTQEEYESKEKGVCIHWMTWDEIIEQSKEDPDVFQDCLKNGCTKAVELTPNETLFNMTTVDNYVGNESYTGDGVSTLYYLLNGTGSATYSNSATWNYSYEGNSSSDRANIYSRSRIRTTLTGDRSNIDEWLTDNPGANDYYGYDTLCDTSNCLLSCFPSNLQEAIVPRTTKNTGNATSGTSANDKTTYDKLFLFSLKETGITDSHDDAGGDDYGINSGYADRIAYEFSNADATDSSSQIWWSRSRYSTNNYYSYCVTASSSNYGMSYVVNALGLSPGFCLPGPENEVEPAATYSVTTDYKNLTGTGATGVNAATAGVDYVTTLTADEGYVLPESVEVTIGGNAASAGTDYEYSWETGELTIYGTSITDDIVITAAAAEPTAFAVYSNTDKSLTFYYDAVPTEGGTYGGKVATNVYTGVDSLELTSGDSTPWNSVRTSITSVVFDESFASVQPKSLAYWFYHFEAATSFTGFENLDTSQVTSVQYTFNNCKSITSIDVSDFDTSSLTNMYGMFYNCTKLQRIDGLSGWDTSGVTDMGYLFYTTSGNSVLESVGDLSDWDTSSVTNMQYMFGGCETLESVSGLSNWDISSVKNISYMFTNCKAMESIEGPSSWDTESVTSMAAVFTGCEKLEEIDLSKWDTSKATTVQALFQNCSALTSMGDISTWDTESVTDMRNVFSGCTSLETLDLSGWNTEKVTSNYSGFAIDCTALDWIKIGDDFDLFTKSEDALVSQKTWYDSDVNGETMSENYLIGVSNATSGNTSGQYWTHTSIETEGPAVKYAVKIWGIGADTYQDEDDGTIKTAGLTFGPATGDNEDGTGTGYITSYKAHLTQEEYESKEKGVCIHWMTWDEIIEQSKEDPDVFQDCLKNGCTKAVELTPNETLFNMTTVDNYVGNESYTGDGVSTLYYLLNGTGSATYSNSATWNYSYEGNSNSDRANIYSRSRIRTTLTGDRSNIDEWLTDNPGANDYYGYDTLCDTSNCLLSCFPSNLQEAIVPRTTKNTGNATSGTSANDKTTYDKLFLFSVKETGLTNSSDDAGGDDYGINSDDSDRVAYEFSNADATDLVDRAWWSRSRYSSSAGMALYVRKSGSCANSYIDDAYGLSPGFCIE